MRNRLAVLSAARLAALVCAAFVPLHAGAQDAPASVSLCHENEDSFPWLLKGNKGYSQIMTLQTEKQLGIPIKMVPMPWKACLEAVKAGTVDGAINSSYAKDRAEYAQYPLKLDGEADATKRMYRTTYALYVAKGSSTRWDGTKLTASGPIAAQKGFSIIAQLKTLGVQVDDSLTTADDLLAKAASGQFAGVALQTTEGENSLAAAPAIAAKIERLNPPLAEKPYYTIFAKGFFAKHGQTAREIWRIQGKLREAPEFKSAVAHMMKSVD